jgi:hypothetical protein
MNKNISIFVGRAAQVTFAVRALSAAREGDKSRSFNELVTTRDDVEMEIIRRKIDDALSAAFRSIGTLADSHSMPTRVRSGRKRIHVLAVMARDDVNE